jgi:hypothetical protein
MASWFAACRLSADATIFLGEYQLLALHGGFSLSWAHGPMKCPFASFF